MDRPPIPDSKSAPSSETPELHCFNCGKVLVDRKPFCPQCGAKSPVARSFLAEILRLLGIIVLAIISACAGAMGACFALMGSFNGADLTAAGIGMALMVVAALSVWGAIKLSK